MSIFFKGHGRKPTNSFRHLREQATQVYDPGAGGGSNRGVAPYLPIGPEYLAKKGYCIGPGAYKTCAESKDGLICEAYQMVEAQKLALYQRAACNSKQPSQVDLLISAEIDAIVKPWLLSLDEAENAKNSSDCDNEGKTYAQVPDNCKCAFASKDDAIAQMTPIVNQVIQNILSALGGSCSSGGTVTVDESFKALVENYAYGGLSNSTTLLRKALNEADDNIDDYLDGQWASNWAVGRSVSISDVMAGTRNVVNAEIGKIKNAGGSVPNIS